MLWLSDLFTPPSEPPNHDGVCGHCKTAVPIDASVCTGCGAYWGTRDRNSTQKNYKYGKILLIVGSIFALFTAGLALPLALLGIYNMKFAQKTKYSWWRQF